MNNKYDIITEMQIRAGIIAEHELTEMARPSTPFSKALRDIITQNPDITTKEIRKHLVDMNIEIPASFVVRVSHMKNTLANKQQQDSKSTSDSNKQTSTPHNTDNKTIPSNESITQIYKQLVDKYEGDFNIGNTIYFDVMINRDNTTIGVSWTLTFRRSTPYDAYQEHKYNIDRANAVLQEIANKYSKRFNITLDLLKPVNKTDNYATRYSEYEQALSASLTIRSK